MEKTLKFLAWISHTFIHGVFFALWVLFALFMTFILIFNHFSPKIMEFLTNIN